jgi:hypothetical protein
MDNFLNSPFLQLDAFSGQGAQGGIAQPAMEIMLLNGQYQIVGCFGGLFECGDIDGGNAVEINYASRISRRGTIGWVMVPGLGDGPNAMNAKSSGFLTKVF